MSLLEQAIEAHGGMERFEALEALDVRLRCGGIALATRGQPRALSRLHARVRLHEPHVRFGDWPRPGQAGVFDGWESRIEAEAGGVVERRRGRRRQLVWDDLNVLHFAGYALWNYATAPFLLARPGFEVEELGGRRLGVTFPADLPTHSRRQTFQLDSRGRIARLDYTAEVFGLWARAAHHCLAYEEHAGLVIPVRRRVVPRGPLGRALPGPTLVSIAIDEVTAA